MKILLRHYAGQQYVWMTAKYDREHFTVNGEEISYREVVAVINDNRKNYMQCSSCKKVFRKGDPKFAIHQKESVHPKTCLGCPHLCAENKATKKQSFEILPDGTHIQRIENTCVLKCTKFGFWSYSDIDSDDVLERCKFRQCNKADLEEIHDIFTDYPGIFDDIITTDSLLDIGYEERWLSRNDSTYKLNSNYEIYAVANKMSIIEKFTIYFDGDDEIVYYSKRYNKLFTVKDGKYVEWEPYYFSNEDINNVTADIAKLYN